jgi:hypothetical protein
MREEAAVYAILGLIGILVFKMLRPAKPAAREVNPEPLWVVWLAFAVAAGVFLAFAASAVMPVIWCGACSGTEGDAWMPAFFLAIPGLLSLSCVIGLAPKLRAR